MAINVERSITVTRGTTPPPPTGVVRPRLDSIDLLRGLVIVLMALDHVRDFLCNEKIDPTDLSRASAALFLTRWVTHFCAPVFVFLAGTAAFLFGSRGKTARELSWFLLMRGLWLVFLELVYVRLMWTFNLHVWHQGPGVLWAIGWSMVVLSALVYLPVSAVATFGVLLIAVHNQFDALKAADLGRLGWLWGIVHSAEAVNWIIPEGGWLPQWRVLPPQAALPGASHPGLIVATGYGLIPWAGVMAAGYGLGALYFLDRPVRRRQLWGLGLMLTLAFVFLRATGIYFGVHFDPIPWSSWPQFWQTALEFLNCNKYPPSLLYLLMTLGPAIAALAAFDRPAGWLGDSSWFSAGCLCSFTFCTFP